MNKPWYLCMNGSIKWAAGIAGLLLTIGGGWNKLDSIQVAVEGLDKRVAAVEQVLMEK